jgi:hypothetical protein
MKRVILSIAGAAALLGTGIGTAHAATGDSTRPITWLGTDTVRVDQQTGPGRIGVTIRGVGRSGVVVDFGDNTGLRKRTTACTEAKARKQPDECQVTVWRTYDDAGRYTITVKQGKAKLDSRKVTITSAPRPWSPPAGWKQPAGWSLSEGQATFAPCSVVPWTLDRTGETPDRAGTISDIRQALGILSAETGLTFTEVGDTASSAIDYSWKPLGADGAAGLGGGYGGHGTVELSLDADWTTDRWAGANLVTHTWTDASGNWTWTLPGRAWLIVHETMHALGIGHVDDPTEVMNPVASNLTALGDGDLDALHTMYRNNPCN